MWAGRRSHLQSVLDVHHDTTTPLPPPPPPQQHHNTISTTPQAHSHRLGLYIEWRSGVYQSWRQQETLVVLQYDLAGLARYKLRHNAVHRVSTTPELPWLRRRITISFSSARLISSPQNAVLCRMRGHETEAFSWLLYALNSAFLSLSQPLRNCTRPRDCAAAKRPRIPKSRTQIAMAARCVYCTDLTSYNPLVLKMS